MIGKFSGHKNTCFRRSVGDGEPGTVPVTLAPNGHGARFERFPADIHVAQAQSGGFGAFLHPGQLKKRGGCLGDGGDSFRGEDAVKSLG